MGRLASLKSEYAASTLDPKNAQNDVPEPLKRAPKGPLLYVDRIVGVNYCCQNCVNLYGGGGTTI